MKNEQPNATQKRWREQVRELGSIISGGPAVIHHCVGRTASHNKIKIGHWFLLPLTDEEHRAIHADPYRKLREKELFFKVVKLIVNRGGVIPFDDDVDTAIESYHR